MKQRVARVSIKVETIERVITLIECGDWEGAVSILRFASKTELRRIISAKRQKCYLEMRAALEAGDMETAEIKQKELYSYSRYVL